MPGVLSRDEVRRLLAEVRIPGYRACLTTIDACGLRLVEGAHLQVADVERGRMLLHIHGKGKHDRYVPLPGNGNAWFEGPALRHERITRRSGFVNDPA